MRDALAFLTILPVGGTLRVPGRTALLAFPLVGLLVGALWAGLAWSVSLVWNPLVAAGSIVLLDLILTGGLHVDAVADLADGIASRKGPDEAIAVMREPTIGGVGAAALVAALLLRLSLLGLMASQHRFTSLAAAPIAGRFAMVWLMSRAGTPTDSSLASALCLAATRGVALAAGLIALTAAWTVANVGGVAAVVVGGLLAEVAAAFCRRRFGGVVGDAVGATGFITELGALALLSAHLG